MDADFRCIAEDKKQSYRCSIMAICYLLACTGISITSDAFHLHVCFDETDYRTVLNKYGTLNLQTYHPSFPWVRACHARNELFRYMLCSATCAMECVPEN